MDCGRCHGLCVVECIGTEERMVPQTRADQQRRWCLTKEEAVMVSYAIMQARCLCCGGVTFLS